MSKPRLKEADDARQGWDSNSGLADPRAPTHNHDTNATERTMRGDVAWAPRLRGVTQGLGWAF